jgi:hypothetical protein
MTKKQHKNNIKINKISNENNSKNKNENENKELENEEIRNKEIDRFRRAILTSKKTVSEKNRAVKTALREWAEFIIGGIFVVGFAVLLWFGINNFTKKRDISQITGKEIKVAEVNSEPDNIKAYKDSIKAENNQAVVSTTVAAVAEYKEELATLQALTVTEASVTVPTASTGAKVIGKYYALHLSTYRDINKAKKDVEYIKTRGFESYYTTEDKKFYRVILNIIFTTMEDAEKFGENMKKQKYIQSFNVKVMENKMVEDVVESKKNDKPEIIKTK